MHVKTAEFKQQFKAQVLTQNNAESLSASVQG